MKEPRYLLMNPGESICVGSEWRDNNGHWQPWGPPYYGKALTPHHVLTRRPLLPDLESDLATLQARLIERTKQSEHTAYRDAERIRVLEEENRELRKASTMPQQQERKCHTCRHENAEPWQEPCESCVKAGAYSYPGWEPEITGKEARS